MSIKAFLNQATERVQTHGTSAISGIVTDAVLSGLSRIPFGRLGTNVYSEKWDVLVLLDACRLDLYRETISSETDYIWSVGSSSEEWLANTFREVDTSQTIYVTGNVFSQKYLDGSSLYELSEMWRTAWDEEKGTIPPRPITDEAIRKWRETDVDRMIVHYMQPHLPAIGSDINVGGGIDVEEVGDGMGGVWGAIRHGDIDQDSVWTAYKENLEFVWNEVEMLMNNIDGSVAVSADHGNCFGEYGTYGHPGGLPWPQLRRVPWDVYDCEDQHSYEPNEIMEEEDVEASVEERLAKLGYV